MNRGLIQKNIREYGYSLKGTRVMADKSGKRTKRITVISGLINRRKLLLQNHLIVTQIQLYLIHG